MHCSLRQGFPAALREAQRLGCDTLQIFTRPRAGWRSLRLKEEECARFRELRAELDLRPLVVHTPYLPNLCSSDPRIFSRSERALSQDLEDCERLGADYLVIHPGAYSAGDIAGAGLARMATAVRQALERSKGVRLLVENVSGGGRRLGSAWEELAALLDAVSLPDRIGICLDTAHTLAAGYPFESAADVRQTLNALDRAIGLSKVFVVHANDSAAARGSHRDLHTHIGAGHIGTRGFAALLTDARLAHCAVILETPRRHEPGADARNLALLRRLVHSAAS